MPGTGLGHLAQPQVDRVGQNGGQQQVPVFGRRAVLEVLEVAGETGPVIDLQQQLGDLQMRQQAVRLLHQCFGVGWHGVVQRRDLEVARAGDGRVGQRISGGESFHRRQFVFQRSQSRLEVALAVGLDGEIQRLLVALGREPRGRQQVVLEILELPRVLHPDIARAQ